MDKNSGESYPRLGSTMRQLAAGVDDEACSEIDYEAMHVCLLN